MLDDAELAYLMSHEGKALLDEANRLEGSLLSRLSRLRKCHTAAHSASALELVELRRKASVKFARANDMYFTPVGLEQASGDATAKWRATRFPTGARILDLCCGCGGDAIHLAGRGTVHSVDLDPAAVRCVGGNADVYGVAECFTAETANAMEVELTADAVFIDPSRRREGRRVRSAQEYSPPLEFILLIRKRTANLAVKVSPVLDDDAILRSGGRVEFVSDRGECKEAVLWFGEIGPSAIRSAAILPSETVVAADPAVDLPAVSEPGEWLYEPDPSIVRAHLVPEAAAIIQGRLMDERIAYLTSDSFVETPVANAYRILEWMPFSLKHIQAAFRRLGCYASAIKKRGVPLEVEDIAAKLKRGGNSPAVLVLTRVFGSLAAVICEDRPVNPR